MTPQPTPQKRHGAFDHLSEMPAKSAACAGSVMPIAAAAAAAALALISSRRVIGMSSAPLPGSDAFDLVKNEHCRNDPGQAVDLGKSHQEFSLAVCLKRDDDPASSRHRIDLGAAKPGDRLLHELHLRRQCLHHQAGYVKFIAHRLRASADRPLVVVVRRRHEVAAYNFLRASMGARAKAARVWMQGDVFVEAGRYFVVLGLYRVPRTGPRGECAENGHRYGVLSRWRIHRDRGRFLA